MSRPSSRTLVELIALLEAGIDFGEDDVDVTPQAEIARRIDALTPSLAELEALLCPRPHCARRIDARLVGRPNVGKSSLFNRLVERDRAIVTATPGTTRDTVTERIALDGIPLDLVDTAGLREGLESLEEAEQLGMHRTREALADAALVLIVLDATQPVNDEDRDCSPPSQAVPHLPSSTNAISLNWYRRSTGARDRCGVTSALRTSALTGDGIAALRERILTLATGGAAAEPGLLTNLRQHQAITTALDALADAASANAGGIPHEMILLDLYRALWALDSLTGQTTRRRHPEPDLLHFLHREVKVTYLSYKNQLCLPV